MSGFDYSHGTLTVTFQPSVSTGDVTKLSTGYKTPGRQVLNNSLKNFLLDGRHRMKVMKQLQIENDVD